MIRQIESWEFLFVSNCILVLVFPFIFKKLQKQIGIMVGLLLLPQVLGVCELLLGVKVDFGFYLKLSSLHWTLSFLSLLLFCQLLEKNFSYKKYFGYVILSGIISAIYPLTSSTMIFTNIFWGLIPGTITIDPIISLDPYIFRMGIFYLTIATAIASRKASVFLWMPFIAGLFFSSAFSTSLSSAKNWPIFGNLNLAQNAGINIYRNEKKLNFFSNQVWQSEMEIKIEELKKKIPEKMKFKKTGPLKLFIYRDDDEKADWIGARQTQIGHFIRGEMHLSEVSPISEILSHELAHLLHGQLDIEWKSFLDPFWFEGFAVALSEQQNDLMRKAAALHAELTERNRFQWPRGFSFFSLYSPRIAYILAGAHASWWMSKNEEPWNHEPSIDIFKDIQLTEKDREWAKLMLQQTPLAENPRLRDCTRLERERLKNKNDISFIEEKLNSLCADWKTNPTYHPSLTEEQIFENDLLRIKDENKRSEIRQHFLKLRH